MVDRIKQLGVGKCASASVSWLGIHDSLSTRGQHKGEAKNETWSIFAASLSCQSRYPVELQVEKKMQMLDCSTKGGRLHDAAIQYYSNSTTEKIVSMMLRFN